MIRRRKSAPTPRRPVGPYHALTYEPTRVPAPPRPYEPKAKADHARTVDALVKAGLDPHDATTLATFTDARRTDRDIVYGAVAADVPRFDDFHGCTSG